MKNPVFTKIEIKFHCQIMKTLGSRIIQKHGMNNEIVIF